MNTLKTMQQDMRNMFKRAYMERYNISEIEYNSLLKRYQDDISKVEEHLERGEKI